MFQDEPIFALLLLDNTSQIYERKWRSEEVQTTLSYVEKTLTPIELCLNLEANVKIWYHGCLNLLRRMNYKHLEACFTVEKDSKNQKRRFNWFS